MKSNNNPKNRQGLLDYQRRQLELSNKTELESRKRRIQSNLDKWVDALPRVLQSALPNKLNQTIIDKIKKTPLKPPYDKNIIISAKEATNATFTAYTMLYALIQSGYVTPSEIKKTSLLDGYNNITGFYTAKKWKDYFFEDNAKVLLVEGGSQALTLLGSKGEDQFWRELIEFTKNNDKLIIITYSIDDKETEKEVFIPSLTSERELNTTLIKNSVFVRLTKIEEEEIRYEQEKTHRGI